MLAETVIIYDSTDSRAGQWSSPRRLGVVFRAFSPPDRSPADWFLLIAGLLELDRLTRRNSVSPHTITLILFWSAVSATMACIAGYMLSLGGGYEADTLDTHQVGGYWRGGVCLDSVGR